MDIEQRVRLNFLEEVEDYFDQIEAVALTLTAAELDPSQLDQALRAAHSVKGGAAMMGFAPLSQIAHHLEEFFKILRVRGDAIAIDAQIESLFLQGTDALRLASRCSRDGRPLDDTTLQADILPIFDQLRSHLGDLRPEDEDLLLAQEENVDVATLIFSSGVEDCLGAFEAQLAQLPAPQLAIELAATAEQLAEFGRMSSLVAFVQLCKSVQTYLPQIGLEHLVDFAQAALATWQRSHALVLIGRSSHLPQTVEVNAGWLDNSNHAPPQTWHTADNEAATLLGALSIAQTGQDTSLDCLEDLDWLSDSSLQDLQDFVSDFGDIDLEPNSELDADLQPPPLVAALQGAGVATLPVAPKSSTAVIALPEVDQAKAATWHLPPTAPPTQAEAPQGVSDELDFPLDEDAAEFLFDEADLPTVEMDAPIAEPSLPMPVLASRVAPTSKTARAPLEAITARQNTTVRVSAQELQHLNTLFGKLIVERNAINLRLAQLQNLVGLMQNRTGQLEQSNRQLRRWYDQASLAGLTAPAAFPQTGLNKPTLSLHQTLASPFPTEGRSQLQQFDALELDRYTDLHVLSQEQIEGIVQLQEVSSDIALSLREASTAATDLNYTTRALQSGLTKIQMRPFSTLVRQFPRMVRDLASQHNKRVSLIIDGEMTLIDRVAVEALAAPLTHLLRNAFDHGIEPPEERLAAGKPATGNIAIRALHRGNQTLITVEDDGRGIDLATIRDRLRRLGMAEVEVQQLSDRDLYAMIFEPGFTTAEQVSELSGRGVGMDIVRTNVQQVRGSVRVETQLGQGTRFTLQVPLAVSVLRVMLVESARWVFAVPLDSIRAVASLPSHGSDGRQTLVWEGQTVELIHLEDSLQFNSAGRVFEMDGTPTINQPTVLVVSQGEHLQGLCIDRFWGEQEISLSPIKSPVALPAYVSGTSILGDGRVMPLVDPFQLLDWVQKQPTTSASVDLAAQPSTGTSAGPAHRPPAAATPPDLYAELPTLLIVDDSINVRRYLALTLEKAGYRVEQAKDGQDAIDKLLAGLQVQAVVCDIEMPRLDGYGVLSELRARPEYQQLPIAMLTSRMNDKHRKLAMNLGASAYFSKPYNEQELLKTLQDLVAKTSTHSA